jgi:hypothetical protein
MQIIDLVPDLRPVILAARQARDARNTLAQFLPNTPVNAVSYRLGRRRRLDQTVPVRAIDAPATPIRRPGVLDVRGDLPAITPIVNLSEQDLTNEMILARQLAGLNVDWEPAVTAAAAQGALTVDNTLEVMRGQLLSTGIVSLTADDGTTHTVDFEIPAAQKVTPATKWTDAAGASTGDPFRDLTQWHNDVYIDASGGSAGVIVTTSRVALHLANRLQAAYPQQPVGQNALAAYMADRGLPPIITYDRRLEAYDGTKTRVFPEGTLVFLPGADAPVGRTELGITQEAVQQVGRQILAADQAAGVTIVTLGQDNPVQRAIKAAAIGLPVLQDTDSIVIASGVFT